MSLSKISGKTPKEQTTLERLTGVNLTMTRWTGEVVCENKKKAGHFRRIRVCPSDDLAFFFKLRRRAMESWINRIGLKFMGCWIIPAHLTENTHNLFSQIAEDFEINTKKIMSKYDTYLENWCRKEPELAHLTKTVKFHPDTVMKRFRMEWSFFKLAPVDGVLLQEKFKKQVEELDIILYEDIAELAENLWIKIFSWRETVTPKVQNSIKIIRRKLDNLNFITSLTQATIKLIDAAIMNLPTKMNNSDVDSKDHEKLKNLIWILKDPEMNMTISQRISEGQSPLEALEEAGVKRILPEKTELEEDGLRRHAPPAARDDL